MLPRDIDEFEALLPEPFQNKALLEQAFNHRSFSNENPDVLADNERLEFLGDSVLGAVISDMIVRKYPDFDEGELTEIRSMLVGQSSLARFATDMQMGEFLLLGRGEEAGNGRTHAKTLCATFEAVVGAIYMDRGFEAVEEFLHPIVSVELPPSEELNLVNDPKTRLQNLIQSSVGKRPSYALLRQDGPLHALRFTMVARILKIDAGVGSGPSRKIAERRAAAMTLHRLGKFAPEYEPDPKLEAMYPLDDIDLDEFID